MSTLKTNAILDSRGNTMMKKGGIIQIVQYSYSTVFERLSNGGWDAMPGVLGNGSASITPRFSDSRILFSTHLHCGNENTWRANLFRTYYRIGGGSWVQFQGGLGSVNYGNTNGVCNTVCNEYLLPTLSTTSAVTFKMEFYGHDSGGYLHLNQNSVNGSSSGNDSGSASTITLKEVQST